MSSGHTNRGGRGNRRARRGLQRPRSPEGQIGQPNSSSAMLILSSGGRQTPAHPERERPPEDESGALDMAPAENEADADDEMDILGEEPDGADENEVAEPADTGVRPDRHEPRSEQQRPFLVSPGTGRGPHERAQPYAPGMRPRPREQASERSETPPSADDHGNTPLVEREASDGASWQERDSAHETPAIPGRWSRAEHDERGEHAPLRPEVRGEVGPLIDVLRGLFEQDRAVASQGGTTRCGICYLHYALTDLEYRDEEGYYVCRACARSLGSTHLPMVRRQQRA